MSIYVIYWFLTARIIQGPKTSNVDLWRAFNFVHFNSVSYLLKKVLPLSSLGKQSVEYLAEVLGNCSVEYLATFFLDTMDIQLRFHWSNSIIRYLIVYLGRNWNDHFVGTYHNRHICIVCKNQTFSTFITTLYWIYPFMHVPKVSQSSSESQLMSNAIFVS